MAIGLHKSMHATEGPKMTLRIARHTSEGRTTIRLMGRAGSEHLQELNEQLVGAALGISLDLGDVTLVNADVVRFLGECEAGGVKILDCHPTFGSGSVAK
jgi:hypothetical protein